MMQLTTRSTLLLLAAVGPIVHAAQPSTEFDCPGSDAAMHAFGTVTVTAAATCEIVKAEMLARVNGQWAQWVDPAMNGTYKLLDAGYKGYPTTITLSRESKQYTDKIKFSLSPASEGKSCELKGCSQSQGTSMADFSTNYCNMRNMYCGVAEKCCPVVSDWTISTENTTHKSMAATVDKKVCSGDKGGGGSGMMGEAKPTMACTFGAKTATSAGTVAPATSAGTSAGTVAPATPTVITGSVNMEVPDPDAFIKNVAMLNAVAEGIAASIGADPNHVKVTASKVAARRLGSEKPRQLAAGAVKIDYTVTVPASASSTAAAISAKANTVTVTELTTAVQTKVTAAAPGTTITVTSKTAPTSTGGIGTTKAPGIPVAGGSSSPTVQAGLILFVAWATSLN